MRWRKALGSSKAIIRLAFPFAELGICAKGPCTYLNNECKQGNDVRSVGFQSMGLGPPEIELYRQLKLQGALEGISEVMELGSQDFWCPQKNLVIALGKAFGRDKVDPVLLNTTNASQQPARLLYEALGIKYGCVDVDGRVGSVIMDLNFDDGPRRA